MKSLTITMSRKSNVTKGQKSSLGDVNIKIQVFGITQKYELYCRLKTYCCLGPLDEWINVALAFEAVKTFKAFINMPIAALGSTVSNRNLARCRLIDIFFHFT